MGMGVDKLTPFSNTSGEPEDIALGPCPGIGQLVGSLMRAAGFAMFDSLSTNEPVPTLSDSAGPVSWYSAFNLNS